MLSFPSKDSDLSQNITEVMFCNMITERMYNTIVCWVFHSRTPPRAAPLVGTARKGTPQHDSLQKNKHRSGKRYLAPNAQGFHKS